MAWILLRIKCELRSYRIRIRSQPGCSLIAFEQMPVHANGTAQRTHDRASGPADLLNHVEYFEAFMLHQLLHIKHLGTPDVDRFKYREPVGGGSRQHMLRQYLFD